MHREEIAGLPDDLEPLMQVADDLLREGRAVEAKACYDKVSSARSDHAAARNGSGRASEALGDDCDAITQYRRALELDPALADARRNLAKLLVRIGRSEESYPLWRAELLSGSAWMDGLITKAMEARDLRLAGEYATILAAIRWGRQSHAIGVEGGLPPQATTPCTPLTATKLLHDLEQFRYLTARGILGEEFFEVIERYQRVADRLAAKGVKGAAPLDDETRREIGPTYGRIVHVRDAPRLSKALSSKWDPGAVERAYLGEPPGSVVVDNFLSTEALESLRLYCLESTIWSESKSHGRLGSLFRDGFGCPLLLQIAEELRESLPNLIGERHPLRHMWAYKSPPTLPPDAITHADFAALNVNFWITPDEANLDETSGGLIVYGVDAPLHWDFHTYNGRLEDVIRPYLRHHQAQATIIPYRQNRAVIFNSDLFHSTGEVRFRPGYENRRTNITMLYGRREDDLHHREWTRPSALSESAARTDAWRSAAFARARR
jgi:tetratricopeptide (TPR) repeat protein